MKLSLWHYGWCVVAAAIPLVGLAASPESNKPAEKEPAASVELFEGIKSGDIDVTVVAKDSKEGTITIKNKTGKPLTIKMPQAFAAVPVLAQMMGGAGGVGGRAGRNGGAGGMGGMGGMQGMGMGMGGMGGGMMGGMGGGMGGMGGMFNVGPEKVQKLKVAAVCLDHGLKDPNPHVAYKLIPIDSYAKSPAVTEVLKMLARGEIDQHSAQAAAWHLQNGLSWPELAGKIGVKHLNGSVEPYFTAAHLERALVASRVADERSEKASKELSPTKSLADGLAQQR
jgi:hypothetical protein